VAEERTEDLIEGIRKECPLPVEEDSDADRRNSEYAGEALIGGSDYILVLDGLDRWSP